MKDKITELMENNHKLGIINEYLKMALITNTLLLMAFIVSAFISTFIN